MSKSVKIRVNWYEFRTSLMIATYLGCIFMVFGFVGGIVVGMPWPPRLDDFTFALCAAFIIPFAWVLISQAVSDFFGALQKAGEPDSGITAESPAGDAYRLASPARHLASPRRARRR